MEHDSSTSLAQYIARGDDSYCWEVAWTKKGQGFTDHMLRLTSQTWLRPELVNHTKWHHWLRIICPDNVQGVTAGIYVVGGSLDRSPPPDPPLRSLRIALSTNTIVADLGLVPNQPLRFRGEGLRYRSETDLDTFCQAKCCETGDVEWLLHFPMTKSIVAAMNAIQEFASQYNSSQPAPREFVLLGASKRARPAWLAASVDSRVASIISIVSEHFDWIKVMGHLHKTYGFFPSAYAEYATTGIYPDAAEDGRYDIVAETVDILSMSATSDLAIPKYLILGASDPYYCADAASLYYDRIPEEKFLRYIPNAEHNLNGTDVQKSIIAFYRTVVSNEEMPQFTYNYIADGTIAIFPIHKPDDVRLWKATNPTARDFRITTLGEKYTAEIISPSDNGTYLATVPTPERGHTAFFVELAFTVSHGEQLKFTTPVRVLPFCEPEMPAGPIQIG